MANTAISNFKPGQPLGDSVVLKNSLFKRSLWERELTFTGHLQWAWHSLQLQRDTEVYISRWGNSTTEVVMLKAGLDTKDRVSHCVTEGGRNPSSVRKPGLGGKGLCNRFIGIKCSLGPPSSSKDRQMDGWTDRWTDRQIDRRREIEAECSLP